jgi:23S rRNA (guanosine2251-2'-O)-methyltransferase
MKTCVLVLDNIRSVENTASIFRTAECLGASKVYLIGTTPAPIDRFGRKRKDFAKVSLGAEEMLEWEYAKEILPVLDALREQGLQILALEQSDESKELKGFKPEGQFALVVGNEVDGISRIDLEEADEVLEIDMKGEKESLNVSVATGIALYELLKV